MNFLTRALSRLARRAFRLDDRPMRAVWKGAVIADSDRTVVVEGNRYFPPEALREEHLWPSTHQTVCHWKGTATYYDVVVGDERNPAAAWGYSQPKRAAVPIKDHVAFSDGVQVVSAQDSPVTV